MLAKKFPYIEPQGQIPLTELGSFFKKAIDRLFTS